MLFRSRLKDGVCGKAARTREVQNIVDVHQFEGHIACDSASNSELVIPIVEDETLIGVLDIDSVDFGRFGPLDQSTMIEAVNILIKRKKG